MAEEVLQALRRFESRLGKTEAVFRSGGTFPRALYGFRFEGPQMPLSDPSGIAPEASAARALAFVEEERAVLGMEDAGTLLEIVGIHTMDDLAVIRMEQRHQGLPVLGGGLSLHVDRSGAVCAAFPHIRRGLPSSVAHGIGAEQAARAATARLENGSPLSGARTVSAGLAIALIGNRYRVVWDLRLSTSIGPYRVLVDAGSGEVLGNGTLLSAVDCSPKPLGLVYPENPLQGEPVQATLEDLACSVPYLHGEYVRSFDWGGTDDFTGYPLLALGIRGSLAGNQMVFDPSSTPLLAQVNVYHHATGFHAWFGTVGFHGLDRPFPTITNAIECYGEFPCANALYDPLFEYATGFGVVLLGVGSGVNFGLESDVICHEYTHAVVAGTSNLGIDYFDPNSFYSLSLNEAFADYFSSSYVGDPLVGEYAGRAFGRALLRRLDNALRWPDDIDTFSFHDTGQIWSGALWDVRQAFSADGSDPVAILRVDRLAYAALVSLSSNAGFPDAADALIAAASSLGFSQEETLTIKDILSSRGLHSSTGELPPQIRRLEPMTEVLGQVAGTAAGSVRLGTVQYEVLVPAHAIRLGLRLEGSGNLDLHARYGAPVTVEGNTVHATAASVGPSSSETLSLERGGALAPGSWFVAISNRTTQIADYTIESDIETSTFENIIPLPPGSRESGSVPGGPALAPVAYSISPGEIAGKKLVITLEADADADLYVRRGRPVELGLEGQIVADVRVRSTASEESLALDPLSVPALEQITYYAAVWNATSGPISYSVEAALEDFPSPGLEEVPLSPDAPRTGIVPGASPATATLSEVQFTVPVVEDGSRLAVGVSSARDVAVFLRRAARVAFEDGALAYDHGSDLPGSGDESIIVDLFSRPRLESGLYYIAIQNRDPEPAEFEVMVELETTPVSATFQSLPSDVWTETTAEAAVVMGSGKLSSLQFQIETVPGSPGLDVIILPRSAGNLDLYLRRNRPVQMIGGRVVADHHAETAGGAETITIFEPDLAPGIYHVGIVNRSTAAIPLEIAAAYEGPYAASVIVDDDDIWEGTISAPGQFNCVLLLFQFGIVVPPNALRLEVDVKTLTAGPLDVFQRFGSRVAIDHVGAILHDVKTRTTDGTIVYSGADLRPGTYFFAVGNCTPREQIFELTMYMKIAGAPEEYIDSDEDRVDTAEPALEASSELHPTQFFYFAGPDRKEAVISVWGEDCADSGLDLLANPATRISLDPDGTTNAAFRSSGGGPLDTFVINSSSVPPFAPGKHYIAIQNNTAEPRPFRLLPTLMPAESVELEGGTPLVDSIDTTGTPGVGLLQAKQYRIHVPPGSPGFEVQLRPTGSHASDIDLHARLGAPVRLFTQGTLRADWSSATIGTGVETLRFGPETHCVGGTYFFAVGNFAATSVQFSLEATEGSSAPSGIPGDSDESGDLDITDAVATLNYLFAGSPSLCIEAANANEEAELNITDPIYLLTYLFLGGPQPRAPFPDCDPFVEAGDCTGTGCD